MKSGKFLGRPLPRLLAVVGFLTLNILSFFWVAAHPAIVEFELRRTLIPAAEVDFGFTAGTAKIPSGHNSSYPMFSITAVTPNGVFAQAGFRSGDIPIAYHGGFFEFCWAIEQLRDGFSASVSVVNIADWGNNHGRKLMIPPLETE